MALTTKNSGSDGRIAVLVIGAGRSGTSVVTAGVGALGIDLGDSLKAGGIKKNPKGFFEDTELLDVNHRVHKAFGLSATGANVRPVEPRAWQTVDLKGLHDEAVAIIEKRFTTEKPFGLKSGGLLRLLPFWEEVLAAVNVKPRYVMALRNPLGVADSRANLDLYRGYQEKSDVEWLIQVIPFIEKLQGHPLVVVDYDQLMKGPKHQLDRIVSQLDLPLNDEIRGTMKEYAESFATKDLYHHRHDPSELADSESVNPLTAEAYLALYELATDAATIEDPEIWSKLIDVQRRFNDMAPVLRYVDFLEDEMKGRYWGLSGFWQKFLPRIASNGQRTAKRTG